MDQESKCPQCGAGVVEQSPRVVLVDLGDQWPCGACDECERRAADAMLALGKSVSGRRERSVFAAITGSRGSKQ